MLITYSVGIIFLQSCLILSSSHNFKKRHQNMWLRKEQYANVRCVAQTTFTQKNVLMRFWLNH